jgi:hypothetical protein
MNTTATDRIPKGCGGRVVNVGRGFTLTVDLTFRPKMVRLSKTAPRISGAPPKPAGAHEL